MNCGQTASGPAAPVEKNTNRISGFGSPVDYKLTLKDAVAKVAGPAEAKTAGAQLSRRGIRAEEVTEENTRSKDDPRAREFVLAPDGNLDWGEIDEEQAAAIRRQPGPIRLQVGWHGGPGEGFGLHHLRLGGKPAGANLSLLHDVVSGFDEIRQAGGGRLLLVKYATDRYSESAFVELRPGDYYSVITSMGLRAAAMQKKPPLWVRSVSADQGPRSEPSGLSVSTTKDRSGPPAARPSSDDFSADNDTPDGDDVKFSRRAADPLPEFLADADVASLPKIVLDRMSKALKATGYDSRGSEDLRQILASRPQVLKLAHMQAAYETATSSVDRQRKEADQRKATTPHVRWERVRDLGTTTNWREAGYIRPDGSLIDLSGKREGGEPNTRALDHREVGGTEGMLEFIAAGNIRMHSLGDYGVMDLSVAPTRQQEAAIERFVDMHGGEITVSLEDGLGEWDDRNERYRQPERSTSVEYQKGTRPARVVNDIRRFFAGETITSGRPMFSRRPKDRFTGGLPGLDDEQPGLPGTEDERRGATLEDVADTLQGKRRPAAPPRARQATMDFQPTLFDERPEETNPLKEAVQAVAPPDLARGRPNKLVTFSTPYEGKTGAKLVGYEWIYRTEEREDDIEGAVPVRVSDWERAATNPRTGRSIVHRFIIADKNGHEHNVSAETAATMLGVAEGTAREAAKKLLAKEIATQGQDERNREAETREMAAAVYPTRRAALEAWGDRLPHIKRRLDQAKAGTIEPFYDQEVRFIHGPNGYAVYFGSRTDGVEKARMSEVMREAAPEPAAGSAPAQFSRRTSDISPDEEARAMALAEQALEDLPADDRDLVERVARKQRDDVERIYADVLRRYDEDGEPLPAPNGKP